MNEEAGVGAEDQGDLCRPLEGLLNEGTEWDPEAMSDLSYEPSFVSDRPYESVAQSPATAPFPWCLLCKVLTSQLPVLSR